MNRAFDYLNVQGDNQVNPEALTDTSLHDPFFAWSSCDISIGTIESAGLGCLRCNHPPAQEEHCTGCLVHQRETPLSFCTFELSLVLDTSNDEDDLVGDSLSSYSISTSASSTSRLKHHPHDHSGEQTTRLKNHPHDDNDESVRPCDVLLGRGPQLYQHPGNVQFHIEKRLIQKEYLRASKAEKKVLSQRLVDKVHCWGGRFLKFQKKDAESGQWIIVSSQAARRKAAQALRETFTPEKYREKRRKYRSKTKKDSLERRTSI